MTVEELNLKITVDSPGLKGLTSFIKKFNGLTSVVTSFGKVIGSVLSKFAELTTETMISAVREFRQFADAMIVAKRTIGITAERGVEWFKELGHSVRDMAVELGGLSAETLAKVVGTAGQLGIKAKDDILAFTEVIAKMGVATDLTATQAAIALPKILKAWQLPIKENIKALGSVINILGNETNATQKEITALMNKLGGAAAGFGLTIDQTAALAATMKSVGIATGTGATAISQIMKKIRLEYTEWSAVLGLNSMELKRAIIDNPVAALQMVFEAYQRIRDQKGTIAAAEALASLGLTGHRVSTVFEKMGVVMGDLKNNLMIASEEIKVATSLDKEFAVAMGTLTMQWQTFKTRITEVLLLIGEPLVEALTKLLQLDVNPLVLKFVEWFKTSEFIKEIWPAILRDIRVGFVGLIAVVVDWVRELAAMPDLWEKIKSGVRGAWETITLIGGVLLEIGKMIIEGAKNWDEWKRQIEDVWNVVKFTFEGIKETLKSEFLSEFFQAIIDSIGATMPFVKEFFQAIVDAISGMKSFISELATTYRENFGKMSDAINIVKDSFLALGDIAGNVLKAMGGHIGTVIDFVGGLSDKLIGVVEKLGLIEKKSHGESVWPEMAGWIGKNQRAVEGLNQSMFQTAESLIGLTAGLTQGQLQIAPGRSSPFTIPAGRPQPEIRQRTASGRFSPQQSQQTAGQNFTTNVNLNGTNIIDEYSLDKLADEVTRRQKTTGAQRFLGGR